MDQSIPSITHTEKALAALAAGHRAWFWFWPEVSAPDTPLILQSFQDDPGMDALRGLARQVPVPEGGAPSLGIASVGEDGVISFTTPGADWARLAALSDWVKANISTHRGLARLHNARFLKNTPEGRVVEVFQNAAFWAGVPWRGARGSIQETARILKRLAPGQDAWFWMTGGVGVRPFLVLLPTDADPSGERLARRVGELLQRGQQTGTVVRGVLRLTAGGVPVLTTQDATGWQALIRSIVAAYGDELPPLRVLEQARMLPIAGGKFQPPEGMSAPAADLSGPVAVLSRAAAGQKVWFWFTDASASGRPMLVLSADRAELKDACAAHRGSGRSVRGQLSRSRKGWMLFRSRETFEGFITALAEWAAEHHPDWPALSALSGARFVQIDAENTPIARQQDATVWGFLAQ